MLKGKIVAITGASKGFGLALAEEFAKEGATIALIARSNMDTIVLDFRKNNWNAFSFNCDVTKQNEVFEIAQEIIKKLGRIDIWINNAGTLMHEPIENNSSKDIEKLIALNLTAYIFGCQAAIKHMKPKKDGHIINIISTSGINGRADEAVYVASKFGVKGLHESLKIELNPFKIRVSAIFPGGMKTTLFDGLDVNPSSFMDPNEVAKLVVGIAKTPKSVSPTELVIQRP